MFYKPNIISTVTNSKASFPDTGEDVKVMAFRLEGQTRLTVAMPFLAESVSSEAQYYQRKGEALDVLRDYLAQFPMSPSSLAVELNSLDEPGKGAAGAYLSLLGTSAESGDSGQVGRGNRVNGLISLNRPASAEAAAGKNPISHVGKLYNVLSFQLAQKICDQVKAFARCMSGSAVKSVPRSIDRPWWRPRSMWRPDSATKQLLDKSRTSWPRCSQDR